MVWIRGEQVTLHQRIEGTERDAFGHPVITYSDVVVNNVLIAPVSVSEMTDSVDLETMSDTYTLGIPKGDANEWKHGKVTFWGKTFEVIGGVSEGMENLIPLEWNKKVTVRLCE